MNTMYVERPGMQSCFQDLGRLGHQKYGVPVNGPMDEWSHRLANALVGNEPDAAVLECTLGGQRLSFSENTLVALCGARLRVTADGRALPYDCAVLLRRGVVLDVGERQHGARLYLAMRGGLASEPVLGSRSTNLRAGFGGFQGRALRAGDRVPLHTAAADQLPIERRMVQSGLSVVCALPVEAMPPVAAGESLRFIPGTHWSAFTTQAQKFFTRSSYELTQQSDRMGIRLKGAALTLRQPLELTSEATVFGTVQVPPDGQPIVLMADRQSAGGYPKIGYVASADLPALAQKLPGQALRFVAVAQADAERLWLDGEARLSRAIEQAAQALSQ